MGCTFKRPQTLQESLAEQGFRDMPVDTEALNALREHEAKYEINDDGSVTFYPTPDCQTSEKSLLSKTNVSNERLRREHPRHFAWEQRKKTSALLGNVLQRIHCVKLEASSVVNDVDNIVDVSAICSFIDASLTAWSNHYPIRFKPEHIWLLILQAVAQHVDENAEKLRKKYVNHQGKMTLTVNRDNFEMDSLDNDWEGVIEEFVDQIDKNTVKDTVQLFECDFSGSTLVEKICAKVTIMDICKNYFSYGGMTSCGFPKITLDGTKEDWVRLKEKTKVLLKTKVDEQFGAEWAKALLPLLDRFIGAFDGDIDCLFWNSMIKRGANRYSGGWCWYTGWFNILFPFTESNHSNKFCVPYSEDKAYVQLGLTNDTRFGGKYGGLDVKDYPSGLAHASVSWNFQGKDLDLKFIAGFMGYQQDQNTLEICPNVGWCIGHERHVKMDIDQPPEEYY